MRYITTHFYFSEFLSHILLQDFSISFRTTCFFIWQKKLHIYLRSPVIMSESWLSYASALLIITLTMEISRFFYMYLSSNIGFTHIKLLLVYPSKYENWKDSPWCVFLCLVSKFQKRGFHSYSLREARTAAQTSYYTVNV